MTRYNTIGHSEEDAITQVSFLVKVLLLSHGWTCILSFCRRSVLLVQLARRGIWRGYKISDGILDADRSFLRSIVQFTISKLHY